MRMRFWRKPPPEVRLMEVNLWPTAVNVLIRNTHPKRAFVRVHFLGAWTGWQDVPVEPGDHEFAFDQRVNAGGASARIELLWVEE